MAKNQRKKASRKSRNKRTRRSGHRGGGGGSGWTMGGPLLPGSGTDMTTNQRYDACLSAARPGQIPFSQTGGLPGMKGGAYTNNLSAATLGGFAQIDRDTSHCMPNHSNPLNNGRIQGGGAAVGPGGGSLLASAAPILEEHTARYTTSPSQWVGSTGAPVLLNVPLDGKMWSKACTQTGGRRKNKKNKSKKNKSKKNKSGSRKQRGGGLAEDAETFLKANGMDPEKMLSKMITARGYTSGTTEVMGDYTFRATGSSRTFQLYVKKTGDDDSSYVYLKAFSD